MITFYTPIRSLRLSDDKSAILPYNYNSVTYGNSSIPSLASGVCNELPKHLGKITSLEVFKSNLKIHLIPLVLSMFLTPIVKRIGLNVNNHHEKCYNLRYKLKV